MDRDRVEPAVTTIPGDRAEAWVNYHHEHAALSTPAYEFVWDLTAPAIGPFCTDVDGNVFLDFTSQVGASPMGYNHPSIAERLEAVSLPIPTKIAGQSIYASGGWPPEDAALPSAPQLMDALTDLTSSYDLDTVFLSNSGAEAVENALKLCYAHRPSAMKGVTCLGAFHGRTLGALSLNRSKAVHRRHFPSIAGIHELPFCTDRACQASTCSCGFFVGSENRSRLQEMLDPNGGYVDPDEIAYIVFEPIQGEGGYRFPSEAFSAELQTVSEEHDIPLIADEIQTGLGRTGEWWAVDHVAVEPDVITSAKALQVGATIGRKEMFPDKPGRISSTWGAGDLISTAIGLTTIEVIQEQNLLEHVRNQGAVFLEALRDARLPGVTNVRGQGLMLAFDLPTKSDMQEVVRAALERGLLVLSCGRRTVRLLPPLDLTDRELELGISLLESAVQAVDMTD